MPVCLCALPLTSISNNGNKQYVHSSDVARPLSYNTKTTYFSRPRPLFLKTIKLKIQDLKKRTLTEKIGPVMPVLPSHAGNRKKPAYYRNLVKLCFSQN